MQIKKNCIQKRGRTRDRGSKPHSYEEQGSEEEVTPPCKQKIKRRMEEMKEKKRATISRSKILHLDV